MIEQRSSLERTYKQARAESEQNVSAVSIEQHEAQHKLGMALRHAQRHSKEATRLKEHTAKVTDWRLGSALRCPGREQGNGRRVSQRDQKPPPSTRTGIGQEHRDSVRIRQVAGRSTGHATRTGY